MGNSLQSLEKWVEYNIAQKDDDGEKQFGESFSTD